MTLQIKYIKTFRALIFILELAMSIHFVHLTIENTSSKNFEYTKTLIIDKITENHKLTINIKNEYFIDDNFIYYQNIDVIHPGNKQELLNSMRTISNSGIEKYSFFCKRKYKTCVSDAKEILSHDISSLQAFNHPFNDFDSHKYYLSNDFTHLGVSMTKKYNNEKIKLITDKVNNVFNELYDPNKTTVENIEIFNNYVIDNTQYDKERVNSGDETYDSPSAYGALFEGYATCMGYTDAMYLFLEKMGVKQFRAYSDTHTWNVVNIDGQWLHLDLTWNDVMDDVLVNDKKVSEEETEKAIISEYGSIEAFKELYQNRYFLLTTEELLEKDNSGAHGFNEEIYKEIALES